ncbi:MAG: Ig-like domain repeat protein [Chloroflexi bacterium]|nr:Ig-like domain repeat protein [Chloroflexota bacterium]MBV9600981.1 Ig-like domain repeat protein [Chloroflexota bacterium]
MNLFRNTRAALAAAVLAVGVLGASVAPSFAAGVESGPTMQQTVTLFTSYSSTQNPAMAFDAPDSTLRFWGVVSPNPGSGTVVMYDGSNPITQADVTDGQFSITLPAFTAQTLDRGTHSLTVQYVGNGVYAPSTSPVFTEVIRGEHF